MGMTSPEMGKKPSAELEPELHEGDGRISVWVWIVVAAITLAGALLAPFELIWPAG